jgi:hypothetical protein
MAFIAYGLTLSQAQAVEERLFNFCTKMDPSSLRHKKYSRVKEGSYRRSAGGRKDDGLSTYSVYVAWCEPES